MTTEDVKSRAAHVPLIVAYGLGLDSTAALVRLVQLGIRPDAILFADTGSEKQSTYDYLAVIDAYLASRGFPAVAIVRYVPKNFKHWPPYYTLEENCLTNGTLPSLAFGFKSCSLKWKAAPQNAWAERWAPARECWARGARVIKLIGFDCGPRDMKRYADAGNQEDPRYDYWYPLIEWGWDRARCAAEIEAAGLLVPEKSSCFFCPSMKPAEVDALPVDKLRRIVIMEARAMPRLNKVAGLWRRATKTKPGSMTEYIRQMALLPAAEIDRLIADTPTQLLEFQAEYRRRHDNAELDFGPPFGAFISELVQIEAAPCAA